MAVSLPSGFGASERVLGPGFVERAEIEGVFPSGSAQGADGVVAPSVPLVWAGCHADPVLSRWWRGRARFRGGLLRRGGSGVLSGSSDRHFSLVAGAAIHLYERGPVVKFPSSADVSFLTP